MNDSLPSVAEPESALDSTTVNVPPTIPWTRCFDRADWLSFSGTVLLILPVYLLKLAPDVTLDNAGIFTTGAAYVGVPNCPGFPLWTLYAWLFTVAVPFSNMAWRVGVSSTVAVALACGFVALLASRCSALVFDERPDGVTQPAQTLRCLRIAAGFVAGMAFGLDRLVWSCAVIADCWGLTFLLFAAVFTLLFCWHHAPHQNRWLYAACFLYGLTLINCQGLLIAAIGLASFVLLQDAALGRDIFAFITLLVAALFGARRLGGLPLSVSVLSQVDNLTIAYAGIGCFSAAISLGLILKTRRVFERWRQLNGCSFSLLLGLSLYFIMPLASMANPPVNWGYARTVGGFFHMLSRGQYERLFPTYSPSLAQFGLYGRSLTTDFGWFYLPFAFLPLIRLHRVRPAFRNCLIGLIGVFLCLSWFMLCLLNPLPELSCIHSSETFFAPSHFFVALFSGVGLTMAGAFMTRRPSTTTDFTPNLTNL